MAQPKVVLLSPKPIRIDHDRHGREIPVYRGMDRKTLKGLVRDNERLMAKQPRPEPAPLTPEQLRSAEEDERQKAEGIALFKQAAEMVNAKNAAE